MSIHSGADRKQALASEALFYYTKGLNSVNDRLGDSRGTGTNGLIVSIMALAIHSLTTPNGLVWCWEALRATPDPYRPVLDEWTLHLNALRIILDGRGGVSTIDSNVELRRWLML